MPRSALHDERSTSAASAITSAPAARTASIASREESPVVTTSSTISTRVPGSSEKPRRSSKVPWGRSTNIAGLPSARPISWPMITPPIAGDTTASIRSRTSAGIFAASARASRSARAGSIRTRAHCRYFGLRSPDERMKCPSSNAPAARNSPRMSSSLIISVRPLSRFATRAKCRLRRWKAAPIERPIPAAHSCARQLQRMFSGVKMRLIGWAIALAAAGLTPAAAQTNATAPVQNAPAAATPSASATPPAGTAQNPDKPDAAQPAIVYGSVGHAIPTPGYGEPDGRKGIQEQVTPIGEEAAAFHNNWLLLLCAIISVFVLALLLYAMVRFRRGANPTPSRNSHNTMIEVLWTLLPVLILVAIAIPSIRLLRHQYSPPPADVTVKVTGHQWYWSYELPDYGVSFDSYMLKEASDPTRQANQRARDDRDGPPLLAVDERLVIPQGKVVKFIVTADDVIHSFAMPAFWIKQDANPGQLHETWAKVDRPGVYFGQCSELCGARHGFMPIAIEVTPPAQFAAWVASKGGHMPGAAPPAPDSTAATQVSPTNATPAAAAPTTTTPAAGKAPSPAPAPNN